MDQLLTEEEMEEIKKHVNTCESCSRLVEAFKEEQVFIKETLQTPTLPDHFSELVLDQLEPYKTKTVRKSKSTPWKKVMILAAGMVLVVSLNTLNPSFAKWIGGLFSTEQVDEGLRIASKAGFAERVNAEVTDQGYTLRVEDIVADPSRIAISYQILDKNGKLQNPHLQLGETQNNVYATNEKGQRMEFSSWGWMEQNQYGLIEFPVREYESTKKLLVKFDIREIKGKEGAWTLEIPVDLEKSLKSFKTYTLKDQSASRHGVSIDMKEVRYAPSTNEIMYETSYTKEELAEIEQKIKKHKETFGDQHFDAYSNYGTQIQYHIENEKGETVSYHRTYKNNGHPTDMGMIQGSGKDLGKVGHIEWNESFIPQKDNQKLTFVLDGVFKTVPTDFSVKVKPKELKRKPVSFEYEGNHMTIKNVEKANKYSLRKSMLPIRKETTIRIEMEGGKEAPSSDFGTWVLEDNQGNYYSAFPSGAILDEKDENGRFKTSIELILYGMEEVPEELTLHLLSATRYYEVKDKWKVPLYESK